ncbi:TetR/AcrR family transcriptional regulator [Streptomyces catenulae]|uniref:Helix-turn-helix domain-containing protein n=1 Tax=Streptomyces catenulae TaxID=66875 RepID=A0ABV2YZR7_9ACTN|nr:TetR/AcrR family transcriptional regulator [Streptomyces catenulae]
MTERRAGGGMSEQRRARLRLEISREAARLFWEQGVAATSGDQIAEAVGLSTRTIWRHFRSKESCAEPIVLQGTGTLIGVLRGWPPERSLEEHLGAELARIRSEGAPVGPSDELLGRKMIRLADTEPALRTAWLMACDQLERQWAAVVAGRLERPAEDLEVRRHAAAAAAVVRVLDEHTGAALLTGADTEAFEDTAAVSRRYAQAIREATGGAIGDPVA